MQKYQNAIQDVKGNAIAGASVAVYQYGTTTLATIYSDNGTTVIPGGIATTDSTGEVYFYAANGRYTLSVTATNFTAESFADVILFDPADAAITSVKNYGAKGDGATDDAAAIQAAITAIQTAGGGQLTFPAGTYNISTTLTISASNVMLAGAGGDMTHNVGTQGASASTKLVWTGAASGTMVKFASPTGASAQKQNGGGMVGFFLQCAGVAGIGLQIQSWDMGEFRDLGIINPATTGVDMGVVATLGDAKDPQNNRLSQISVRCAEGSGAAASFLRLDGDSTANTSLNVFEQIDGIFVNGNAYLLKNCDNNVFIRCRAFRASGTGASIEFQGSNSALAQTARSNVFLHFTSNAAAICRGTSSYTYASYDNNLLYLDQDNSTPAPTVETGSSVYYSRTDNIASKTGIIQIAGGSSAAEVTSAKTRMASTESMRLYNGSANHLNLDDGTNVWGMRINSASLTLTRFAGSGYFVMPLDTIANYADDTAAAAGGVPVGGTYRTASALKVRVT